MIIKTGVDIVEVNEFSRMLKSSDNFPVKVFHDFEMSDSPQSLSGIFAAKEAVIKAFGLEGGSWMNIRIIKADSGKPAVEVENFHDRIQSADLSISHTENLAIAVYSALLN